MQVETVKAIIQEVTGKRPELATRLEKAAQILSTRAVRRIGAGLYQVESQSRPGTMHLVTLGPRECDCPDFQHRAPAQFCKHVLSVLVSLKAKERESLEVKGQMFAHLVNQGVPVMAALQQVRG